MLVSVIIPTYNRAATIGKAVESVLNQTYGNIEVIVVDDGSQDATREVLDGFDEAIKAIYQKNAGPSVARNRGVSESKGGILSFLDSDDVWLPDKIERQVGIMNTAGDRMCCCVCSADILGLSGERVGNSLGLSGIKTDVEQGEWLNPAEVLATRFLLFNQVVAVRREAFHKVGGFNDGLRLLEDYELALKLSACGSWGLIASPLVIKKNDEDGIGVACEKDRLQHAQSCVDVIEGFLSEEHGMGDSARNLLEESLDELRFERRAETLIAGHHLLGGSAGKAMKLLLRIKKALRRRGSSWPDPMVRSI